MLPENNETPVAPATKMPSMTAEIFPALLMPPPKLDVFSTSMALLPAEIVPRLPMAMPPETKPALTAIPLPVARIVPLSTIEPWMVLPLRTPIRSARRK